MSDYGLKIVNNNSEVQIDSTYRNLSKVFSGSASLPNPINNISIGSWAEPPLVAVRPSTSKPCQGYSLTKTGSNYTTYHMLADYTSGSGTIYYVGFNYKNASLPSGGYGLVVRNAAGEVCFSSEERYLKIKSINSITDTWTIYNITTNYVDVTVQNTSTNYFLLTTLNHYQFPSGLYQPPNIFWWSCYVLGMRVINTTTLRVEGLHWMTTLNQGAGGGSIGGDFQIIEIGY